MSGGARLVGSSSPRPVLAAQNSHVPVPVKNSPGMAQGRQEPAGQARAPRAQAQGEAGPGGAAGVPGPESRRELTPGLDAPRLGAPKPGGPRCAPGVAADSVSSSAGSAELRDVGEEQSALIRSLTNCWASRGAGGRRAGGSGCALAGALGSAWQRPQRTGEAREMLRLFGLQTDRKGKFPGKNLPHPRRFSPSTVLPTKHHHTVPAWAVSSLPTMPAGCLTGQVS